MTIPRLHALASQATERIRRGQDPLRVITAALVSACGHERMPPVYEQLSWRSRAVCWALWGEPPLRAVDVHRVIGGSYHAIHQLLLNLMREGLVERVGYGLYALPAWVDQPVAEGA